MLWWGSRSDMSRRVHVVQQHLGSRPTAASTDTVLDVEAIRARWVGGREGTLRRAVGGWWCRL